ncbi:hypothetical protein PHAVU_008G277268 [Phaseolus vulgaris]
MKSSMGMGWLFPLCCHFLLFHFSFSHSLCHPHDNLALLHFKASLTITTTYSSYYYDYAYGYCHQVYPTIATWENGTDCCSWSGVTCHPISGHVTAIDLACGGLQGKINANSTLFTLSHMQSLNLAFNDFSNSQIPPPIVKVEGRHMEEDAPKCNRIKGASFELYRFVINFNEFTQFVFLSDHSKS